MSLINAKPSLFLTPESSQADSGFALLEDYGGALDELKTELNKDDTNPSKALGTYIDFIVKYSIGLLSIGGVIMLIYAGITYITSEIWSKKSDAKDIIFRTIGALVLMFSAFIFFNQLNPELLKVRFKPISVENDLGVTTKIDSLSDIWSDENMSSGNFESRGMRLEKDGWAKGNCKYEFEAWTDSEDEKKYFKLCETERKSFENNNKEWKTDKCFHDKRLWNSFCYYKMKTSVYNETQKPNSKYTTNFSNLQYAANRLGYYAINKQTNKNFGGAISICREKLKEEEEKIDNIYQKKCFCVPVNGEETTKCLFFKKSVGKIIEETEEEIVEQTKKDWILSTVTSGEHTATLPSETKTKEKCLAVLKKREQKLGDKLTIDSNKRCVPIGAGISKNFVYWYKIKSESHNKDVDKSEE